TFILLAGYPPFPLKQSLPANATAEQRIAAEIEAIEFGRSPTEWRKSLMEEPWNNISTDAKLLVSKMLSLDPKRRITTVGILQDGFIARHTNTVEEFTDFE